MKKKIEKKKKYQHTQSEKLAVFFRWSSSFFALIGGLILASNIKISPYGFVVLAGSSSQLLISSLLVEDKSLIIYSGSIFIFVDLLGIYRWLIS